MESLSFMIRSVICTLKQIMVVILSYIKSLKKNEGWLHKSVISVDFKTVIHHLSPKLLDDLMLFGENDCNMPTFNNLLQLLKNMRFV